ncbi:MAG: glycosyltransferase family 39 protein [Leptospiraceae bacterium]|nr:glycosyltransferase family 39 protein [Leptospiraceae bacterium]
MVQQAYQIILDKPVYTDASVEYTPLLYAPSFFYLSALNILIFGKSLFAVRLISIASIFLLIIVVYKLYRIIFYSFSEPVKIFALILSIGLFLACYKATLFWLDLAKVDSLFLFFIATSLYFFIYIIKKESETVVLAILFAIFSSLLFFTKQTGIFIGLSTPFVLWFFQKKKSAIIFSITFLLLTSGFMLFFNFSDTASKYFLYNIELPSTHPLKIQPDMKKEFFSSFTPSLFALVLLLVLFLIHYLKRKISSIKELYYELLDYDVVIIFIYFIIVNFLISFAGRLKLGAVANSWLYYYFVVSLFSSYIGTSILFSLPIKESKLFKNKVLQIVLILLILGQYFTLRYDSFEKINEITQNHKKNAEYTDLLCKLEQPVLFPTNPYLTNMYCGTRSSYLAQAVQDTMGHGEQFSLFFNSYKKAIENRDYKTILEHKYYPESQINAALKYTQSLIDLNQNKKDIHFYIIFQKALELQKLTQKYYTLKKDDELNIYEKQFKELNPGIHILKPNM